MIRSVFALCTLVATAFVYAAACSSKPRDEAPSSNGSSAASAPAVPNAPNAADAGDLDASVVAADTPDAADAGDDASDASVLPGKTEGCPANMVLVQGNYCPEVLQKCLEHHEEFKKDEARKKKKRDAGETVGKSTVSERCLKYEAPSVCLSKERRPMRFCIDRYEWPNVVGEKPMFLISWVDAKKECEKIGKRLCTEAEFNFACEGEDMLPYTYGYERDPQKCNIDRPYRKREKKLSKYARCYKDPVCKAEIERLDQRLPVGSMPACVSPFGAFDLNGNINEWVEIPKQEPPNRSGLKGGWWGPVRGRCRPTVDFHKEEDYGYEEGFRCCAEAN